MPDSDDTETLTILLNDGDTIYVETDNQVEQDGSLTIEEGDRLFMSNDEVLSVVNEDGVYGDVNRSALMNSAFKSFTSGDPHVYPVFGESYELYERPYNYRMLQGLSLFINASTRYLSSKERDDIKSFYKKVNHVEPPSTLQADGVFYEKVYISSENNSCMIEFDYDTIKIKNSDPLYFTICKNKSGSIKTIEKDVVKSEYIIKFNHSVHGILQLHIRTFLNPQIKYGFSLQCEDITKLSGLLVREYALKSMRVKNIKNGKHLNGTRKRNRVYTKQKLYKLSY